MANEVYYNRGTLVDIAAGITLPVSGAANAGNQHSITHPAPDEYEIKIAVTPNATATAAGETFDVYIATEDAKSNIDGSFVAQDTNLTDDQLANCQYVMSAVCEGAAVEAVAIGIARIVAAKYYAIVKNSTSGAAPSALILDLTPIYPQGQ